MSKTPASLLERLRQPDNKEAWDRFVDLYTPLLYFWTCRMGLQAQDAADLVQDVFAVLLQKLPEFSYDPGRSFRAWLRTLTINRWRDALRRKAAALRGGTPDRLDEVAVPDHAQTIWETEYRQQVVGRALEIMQSDFQPTTWQACLAVIVDGKSAETVAAELGLTVEAVYAARSRVLRRLRHELAGMLD
jgi:RNA polymerase sigma-70 factor (ECF subfamily)